MRRTMVAERAAETRERAQREFFPKLQQAPGFVSFTLIQGESGHTTVVSLWESQAQADTFFQEAGADWMRVLDAYGHQLETRDQGEVREYITAQS